MWPFHNYWVLNTQLIKNKYIECTYNNATKIVSCSLVASGLLGCETTKILSHGMFDITRSKIRYFT
jgi:hypothetical protein